MFPSGREGAHRTERNAQAGEEISVFENFVTCNKPIPNVKNII